MKKFHIASLGCRTNQYESQAHADQLRALGLEAAGKGEEADLCIVNTCTVTEGADRSSRQQIRALLRDHPRARIAVTGCMAERVPAELKGLDPRVEVVPNAEKEKLLERFFPHEEALPEFNIKAFDAHTRAFVKVQDGCNSYCTYCIIPYVRGKSRSRQIPEIIKEVEGLIANGYKEVVLTGINIGDFDGGGRLADLVRAVDAVPGLHRLRISSIDPDEVDDDLTDAVLSGKTTCPSMHVVLQSGSNAILKRMNRKYTRQIFLDTVTKLKRAHPDFTFTTDVIVGFPGESDADFAETLQMASEVEFAKIHIFPFSPRERTRAALYPNQVPQATIQARRQELAHLSEQKAFSLRGRYVGRTMSVLVEAEQTGHTENFLSVQIQESDVKPHDICLVRLVGNGPTGLVGAVCA